MSFSLQLSITFKQGNISFGIFCIIWSVTSLRSVLFFGENILPCSLSSGISLEYVLSTSVFPVNDCTSFSLSEEMRSFLLSGVRLQMSFFPSPWCVYASVSSKLYYRHSFLCLWDLSVHHRTEDTFLSECIREDISGTTGMNVRNGCVCECRGRRRTNAAAYGSRTHAHTGICLFRNTIDASAYDSRDRHRHMPLSLAQTLNNSHKNAVISLLRRHVAIMGCWLGVRFVYLVFAHTILSLGFLSYISVQEFYLSIKNRPFLLFH